MSDLKNIIGFYRDCYQFDLKGVRIRNFASRQCEHRLIPDTNDFFHDNVAGIPVQTDWGKQVEASLFLHSKEKILYAGSVFVKGSQNVLGKLKEAYIPLYIHELNLKLDNDVYFIEVKDTWFNPDFVDMVNQQDQTLNLNLAILSQLAPTDPFGFSNFILLKDFFQLYLKDWDLEELQNYQDPLFNFKNHFEALGLFKGNEKKLFSSLMFGVFKKPEGSLGVLSELNYLSEKIEDSKLLMQFFQKEVCDEEQPQSRDIYLPTTLSLNQESALFSTDVYPITQIIGPPGTGKSYTISALAIDAVSNNKSVLIVTRNDQACKVISNIIEEKFGLRQFIIKAFNQNYKRALISRLNRVIKIKINRIPTPYGQKVRIKQVRKEIQEIEEQILKIEELEYEWGLFYASNQDNFFSKLKDRWYQYRKRNIQPIWKLNEKLKLARAQKSKLVKRYIKIKTQYDLSNTVKTKKTTFLKLSSVLKEYNLSNFYHKLSRIDFDLIVKAIPLWTCTSKNISRCLPLKKELFDLVIFDEASQCDIATAIPSIYRGKKLIVVGDPFQLRNISFLSNEKQSKLKQENDIHFTIPDYRKESLIDWTNKTLNNPYQSTYLDEHFRSKTDIIKFSNEYFYNNELKLIRSNPASNNVQSLELCVVKGKRNSRGINEVEIEEILDKVLTLIENHTQVNSNLVPTIGITSPFSEQVKHLKKRIGQVIPIETLKRHKVLIGTPFHFQGEERDHMYISFCLDDNAHTGSFRYLNRKDVFNVLITRARNYQTIITSLDIENLKQESIIRKYLLSIKKAENFNENIEVYDNFLIDVEDFLRSKGYQNIQKGTMSSGVVIDLVVIKKDQTICIDLIGYPGQFEDQFNLEDLRILNRLDTPIFFLPYSNWYLENEKSKMDMIFFIEKSIDPFYQRSEISNRNR